MKLTAIFRKDFYRYLLFRLKRSEFKTLLYLDLRLLMLFLILFSLNILIFFSDDVELHMPALDAQIFLVETIIRVISIFLGILFSFIVLSFNIFYKYFGRFAFQTFFKLKGTRFLFTLLLLNLIFLLYTSVFLKQTETQSNYSNSLYLLSVTISLVSTIAIVPIIISLLRQSQSRQHIKSLIGNLNVDWVISYYENVEWKDRKEKHYEKDPITLLTEIGTSCLKEFDFITLRFIVHGSVDFFRKNISSSKEEIPSLDLYWEFTRMFLNLYQVAVKERNENGMLTLLNSRFRLEEMVITNREKVQLYDNHGKYLGWHFKFEIKDYFNRAAQFNEDIVCQKVIDTYRDFGKKIIEVLLPGNFDFDPNDRVKFMDEQSMIQGYLSELDYLMSVIVLTKKFHLYRNISNLYYTLDSVTASSNNTFEAKRFIFHVLDYSKYENLEKYLLNSGVKSIGSLEYPYWLSPHMVLEETEISIPFHGMLKSLNLLFATGVLSNNTINCLKTESFFLIERLEKAPLYKKLLLLCVKKFKELRDFVKEEDSDYRKDVYLKLYTYLGYVDKYCAGKKVSDSEVRDLISGVLAGFVYKDAFTDELRGKGHIFDERIA